MVVSHGEMHKDEENSTGELKALNTPTPDNTNGQANHLHVDRLTGKKGKLVSICEPKSQLSKSHLNG